MARKTYDMILSLGGSCAAASQLKWRGLRQMSFPFDWLYCVSPATLDSLAACFEADFKDWPRQEDMIEMGEGEKRPNAAPFQYREQVTGFRFIHDFRRFVDGEKSLRGRQFSLFVCSPRR